MREDLKDLPEFGSIKGIIFAYERLMIPQVSQTLRKSLAVT